MTDFDHLTPARRRVAEYLDRAKLASPSDVAEAIGKSQNAANVTLQRMHKDGEVVRPMRGYYCLPEVADELDIPVQQPDEESEQKKAVANPLTGPSKPVGQQTLGFEEGRRRSNIAKIAKTIVDSQEARSERTMRVTAKKHPWWPMRTDWRARFRWWVADKLARMIVWLIPREELPNKDEIYGDG